MISSLSVSGFRGISAERHFTFGAITLLCGRNGLGKTTVFEAIDWGLFGSASKNEEERQSLRNLYHPDSQPRVVIDLTIDGQRHRIVRDGSGALLDGSRITDRDLTEVYVRDPDIFPPHIRDLEQRVRRLVYVRQEEIRFLLYGRSRDERAAVLQSILGIPNAELVAASIRKIEQRLAWKIHER